MGDPTKFNYILEYYIFNISVLSLLFSEVFIFFHTHQRSDRKETNKDRGTKWLLYLNFIFCILFSFYCVSQRSAAFIRAMKLPAFCTEVGIFTICLGIIIRINAVLTLKKSFTLNVQTTSEQRLITSGLYRVIRHPAYTGSILSLLGIALALRNTVAVCIVFICSIVCYQIRIEIEEAALQAWFKEEYSAYKRKTYRLFPYIY